MLVFVDESGDAGLKLESGSSEFLTVMLVIFESHDAALLADERICALRNELSLRKEFEFKFNKLNESRRLAFLNALAEHDFCYCGIVIDKRQLTDEGLKYKDVFYKHACSLAFETARCILNEATVIIDGSGSREFKQQLQNYLKKKINNEQDEHRCIKKVKIQDSKKNNLLQLADMICGSVARSYLDKEDAALYRNIVCSNEMDVKVWYE